jgi:Na+-transporting methylmalonyl-CoA/oxaloacetate decarboxylase gamma subunit
MLFDALNLMGVGIGVVFVVLAVFFGIIKLLMKVFDSKEE